MLNFGNVNLWATEGQDAEPIYRWRNSSDIRRLACWPAGPTSTSQVQSHIANVANCSTEHMWSVKDVGGKMMGIVNLMNIDERSGFADIGVVIGPAYQGQQVGFQAVAAVVIHAFEELRLHRLNADILAINAPSIALFQKLGFQQEGVKRETYFAAGHHLDLAVFGLLASEYVRPEPPQSRADKSSEES